MTVTVRWEENHYSQVLQDDNIFNFNAEFPEIRRRDNLLFKIQFSESLLHPQSGPIRYLIFKDFSIFQSFITIESLGGDFHLPIPQTDFLCNISTMTQNDAFPAALNRPLLNVIEPFTYSLFYTEAQNHRFITYGSCFFHRIRDDITRILQENRFGTVDIMIKHVLDPEDGPTEFIPFMGNDRLFQDLAPRKVMTLIVKAERPIILQIGQVQFTVKEMSRIPKAILRWTLPLIQSVRDTSAEVRRLSSISANGGIPLNLLDSIPNLPLSSENFERQAIHFSVTTSVRQSVSNNATVKYCIENLRKFTDWSSSEATLRSLIWDPLIGILLLGGQRARLPFKVFSEFNLGDCLQTENGRRADIAAVQTEFGLPILLVEMGKANPVTGRSHKDYTKLLGSMTASCQHLCAKMRDAGKDPRLARVYGLWVGNTNFHCVVGHPKFWFNPELNRTEVSVHLTYPEHWRFDLLEPRTTTQAECHCCTSNEIIRGDLEDLEILAAIPIANVLDRSTQIDDPEEEPAAQQPINPVIPRHPVNRTSICKLKIFLDLVRRTSSIIFSSDNDGGFNDLFPGVIVIPQKSLIAPSRASSAHDTPHSRQVHSPRGPNDDEPPTSPSNRPRATHTIVKRMSFEFELYKLIKKSQSSLYFPRIYFSKPLEDGKHCTFTFEKMEPLLDYATGDFNPAIIQKQTLLDFLLEAAVFSIHVLFQLKILHEEFGVVHSDISPNNVMYSTLNDAWKLNDFNRSLPIDQSLKASRIAGTPEFIAPESLVSGIYTVESDVYALGQILSQGWCLQLILMSELGDEMVPPYVDAAMDEFFKTIIGKMCHPQPQERISVFEALKISHAFLVKYIHPNFIVKGERTIIEVVSNYIENDPDMDAVDDIPMERIGISEY